MGFCPNSSHNWPVYIKCQFLRKTRESDFPEYVPLVTPWLIQIITADRCQATQKNAPFPGRKLAFSLALPTDLKNSYQYKKPMYVDRVHALAVTSCEIGTRISQQTLVLALVCRCWVDLEDGVVAGDPRPDVLGEELCLNCLSVTARKMTSSHI